MAATVSHNPKSILAAERQTLRFGLTPVFLSNDLQILAALRSYLAASTGHEVELVTRRTYQEVTSLLISGQLDAAWICGYPFIQYRSDLDLVAIPEWNGRPLYQSYLIVTRERQGETIRDLRGDVHAFSDPDSNSGYLVTRTLMHEEGLDPETFFRKTLFTYGHRNVIRAVAANLAQSGSVDGYVWEVMRDLEPELVGRTRILRKSEWLGFPPIATSARRAGTPVIRALAKALLDMTRSDQGRKVLDMLRLSGFGAPQDHLFDGIAAKVALLRGGLVSIGARLNRLPLTWRVPLAVTLLMIAVSVIITERVLDRLGSMQEAYLQRAATSYLDGVTASISPSVLREDAWEIFDALERLHPVNTDILPAETIVTTPVDVVLAATNPASHPSLEPIFGGLRDRFSGTTIRVDPMRGLAYLKRDIVYQDQAIGRIYTVFDAAPLLRERREVLVTLVLTNTVLTGLLSLTGFLTVRRMIRPMQVLESHMIEAADGHPRRIDAADTFGTSAETRRLYAAFNSLLQSDDERRALSRKLAEEEKLASLGRLSSVMAHEINNPLGGLLTAVDTLRAHGEKPDVRNASLDLLQRGLEGIAGVVHAALATYRPERHSRPIARSDFEDAKVLLMPELRRRGQHLDCQIALPDGMSCACPSGPIRQATINLLLNASAATPDGGVVGMTVALERGRLVVEVRDQGGGLPRHARRILVGEPDGSLPTGSGLGLWIVRQIADEIGAAIEIADREPVGSAVRISLLANADKGIDHAA
ncbi:PhnD/SsuA/transferrin family substrate-binding protein [Polymorphum gilvum]|uniref:histidine kinase n=1 Tax=Polymorphum gilvum (strain LMG 25793 / CGMCC 1.9160 / SL003B-26A1) TaxID=991905 RepID=F2J0S5_POLGS|nr:PhnD/SsuA/transferrin family substrate-binding protein [Polymorphum gilvum]ADZ70761.1 Phosphate/phosphonate ABC transporter [Polymorphum gilvum SL003B-26A1]